MGILSKENISKAIENPFSFVVIILLIILALSYSFSLWCFIGGLIAILPVLFGKDSNSVISFFCNDSSWKIKITNFLSELLREYILLIILLSFAAWLFFNRTERGREILSFLD